MPPLSSTGSTRSPFWFYEGDGDFGGSEFQCRVLQSDGKEVKEIMLDNPEKWEQWFKNSEERLERLPNPDNGIAPGYEILLSARVTPITHGIEASLTDLPVSSAYWKRIVKCLFVDKSLLTVMDDDQSRTCSYYFPTEINQAKTEVYNASVSAPFPGRFAVSSTHFVDSRFTTAVFFGCDSRQMDRISYNLKQSPHIKSHRLLPAWLFIELQKYRMERQVTEVMMGASDVFTRFFLYDPEKRASSLKALLRGQSSKQSWIDHSKVRKCRLDARLVIDEIRSTQAQLWALLHGMDDMDKSRSSQNHSRPDLSSRPTWSESSAVSPLDQQSETKAGAEQPKLVPDHFTESPSSGETLLHKLREISFDFDAMISKCQRGSDDMAYTIDSYMAEINTELAAAAARDARASKALGFAAMVYLPITSLATIFAMPIFDWKARWLDHNGHYVPAQPSPTRSSGVSGSTSPDRSANSEEDPGALAVVSGYFWIYLGVALLATFFTVGAYIKHTRRWQHIRRYMWCSVRFCYSVLLDFCSIYRRFCQVSGAETRHENCHKDDEV